MYCRGADRCRVSRGLGGRRLHRDRCGTWPRKPSFRRAARWDGVFPGGLHGNLTLDEIREMVGFIRSQRPNGPPIDVMVGGDVPFDNVARARDILAEYAAAGVTWWVEGIGEWRGDVDAMAASIRGGPPRR